MVSVVFRDLLVEKKLNRPGQAQKTGFVRVLEILENA